MPTAPPPATFVAGRYVSWLVVTLMGAASVFSLVMGFLNWREIGV